MKPLPVLAERAAAWQAEHPLMAECPAGGVNPQGFHPFVEPIPDFGRKNSGMADRAPPPLWRTCPAGGVNPQGFHPFVKPLPVLAERTAAWQAYHSLMAAVLPLRARNAAIRGCSACRERCRIGEGMNNR
ncbi:MAG: hypothetical protein LBK61_11290 [Spirochaetaceae bacterium]|nr:hypothetical protein [Spirochaetaceae bacterium]